MRKLSWWLLALSVLLVVSAWPAAATGNSYIRTKPVWGGKVLVVDSVTGEPVAGAYVVGHNIPTGTYALALQIVNRDDGRMFDQTDAAGRARAQIRPLGSLVIWLPGYHPVKYFSNMQQDTAMPPAAPGPDGAVTIKLVPAVSAEERQVAARQAAEWLEPARRAPFLTFGRRANRSVALRAEARAALVKDGALAEE